MTEREPLMEPTPSLSSDSFSADLLPDDVFAGDLCSTGLFSLEQAFVDTDALGFSFTISREEEQRVVHLAGELDLSARGLVYGACLDGDSNVVVEMGRLTFMDCAGYGGLIKAGLALEGHGHSLVLRNQAGQPAQIMEMFLSGDRPP